MLLPATARDDLVQQLDDWLDAFGGDPDPEAASTFLIELLETVADDCGIDDIVGDLEESGALDGTLADVLEAEMKSNDEFEFTGEEIVSLVERLCAIDWDDDDDDDDDDDELDDETEDI